jgi:hypothetical protein
MGFRALVVDVTGGAMYICTGTLVQSAVSGVSCLRIITNGVPAFPGAAALSPLGTPIGASPPGFPGIWKVSGGTVTFCSNESARLGNVTFYCVATRSP